MATEGKTLGTSSVKCESCEEDNSVNFCVECHQPLCFRCTKMHGRIASTKHHNPIPISEYKSLASSSRSLPSKAYCAKHETKTIEQVCEDCLVVICADCEPEHKGHNLTQGYLDSDFLQRVSAQKIPGLLEIIQQLRKLEDGSPEKIKLYKEAERLVKSWKDRLLDVITKDADTLLGEIRDEIRKHEKLQAETSTKVKECIVKTDHQISKLSESRKISDTTKLLDQLSRYDSEIDDIKLFIEKVKSTHEKQTINDVLPYKDEFDKAVGMVKNIFTKWGPKKGILSASPSLSLSAKVNPNSLKLKRRGYDKLRMICKTVIHGEQDYYEYAVCGTYLREHNQITIFQVCGNKICVFNKNLQVITSDTCPKKIVSMVSIAPNRYVMIEQTTRIGHLLDEKFCVIKTLFTPNGGFRPLGLCAKDENIFIVSETKGLQGPSRFTEINLKYDDMMSKHVLYETKYHNWNGLMAYHDGGSITYTDTTGTELHRISREKGDSILVYKANGRISCICSDQCGVLFGEIDGSVHRIEGVTYQGEIIKKNVGGTKGLQPIGSGVFVLSHTYLKLFEFQ